MFFRPKKLGLMGVFLGIMIFLGISGSEVALSNTVKLPITAAYIPQGFDSNDKVEIVVSAYLPNLCHQMVGPEYRVSDNKIYLEMKGKILAERRFFCAQVMVPFTTVLTLNYLPEGQYEVITNEFVDLPDGDLENKVLGNLVVVTPLESSLDNYIYARVERVEKKLQNGENKNILVLVGKNPSDCFELDRVEVHSNGQNTYSVLPILKQRTAECHQGFSDFRYEVSLPEDSLKGQVLIHVRTMHGGSLNMMMEKK